MLLSKHYNIELERIASQVSERGEKCASHFNEANIDLRLIHASKQIPTIPRPYFDPTTSDVDCDSVLDDTLAKFGYKSFRTGQREAIKRILRSE